MVNSLAFAGYLFFLAWTVMILRKNKGSIVTADRERFSSKWVTATGLLAGSAALLQLAPVFLPVIGLALSPLSSLPLIISVLLFADGAVATFLTTVALLFVINAEEAVIFLFTTGPLGLAAALTAIPGLSLWRKLLLPTALLTCGILLLVFLVGLPGLTSLCSTFNAMALLSIITFSCLYSLLFMGITRLSHQRLMPIFTTRTERARGKKQTL